MPKPFKELGVHIVVAVGVLPEPLAQVSHERLEPVESLVEGVLRTVLESDKELSALPLTRHDYHGDWNYTLTPRLHNQTCGETYRSAVSCSRAPVH